MNKIKTTFIIQKFSNIGNIIFRDNGEYIHQINVYGESLVLCRLWKEELFYDWSQYRKIIKLQDNLLPKIKNLENKYTKSLFEITNRMSYGVPQ